ncbi:MAG: BolA family protein [Candidatus Omnitrophota bacterium]|nr:BolA family protein [Candidatus Omnitrophota bacterium]
MTKEKIEKTLRKTFQVRHLEVIDDSHLHAGHVEALTQGGGHFHLLIVAKDFEGKKPVERHRMIYAALKDLKPQIHALGIQALTPQEKK